MCINVPTSNHNSAKVITLNFSVVYYHVPTSNHNGTLLSLSCLALYIIMFLHQTTTNVVPWSKQGWLYIIMFLHQTTTVASQLSASASCILSCSYIKPQLYAYSLRFPRVVYYHVPTSNHNHKFRHCFCAECCILSCSYIKPQLARSSTQQDLSCILSCSYIKPQLA